MKRKVVVLSTSVLVAGAALAVVLTSPTGFPTANAVVVAQPEPIAIGGACPEGFFCARFRDTPCCVGSAGCECLEQGFCRAIYTPLGHPPVAVWSESGLCVQYAERVNCCDVRTCSIPPCSESDCQSCGCVQDGFAFTKTRHRLWGGAECGPGQVAAE